MKFMDHEDCKLHSDYGSLNVIRLSLQETFWSHSATVSGEVTKLTVNIYQNLITWGELLSPSVISLLMNTSPRTVHISLQEARKLGILSKSGRGALKNKSMFEQTIENQ